MTCHDALALLGEYVDKELSADKEAQIKEHLADCSSCREEFESTFAVKELLRQSRPADPGEEYWLETTRLIRARTTESSFRETEIISVTERRSMERSAFVRSLVSVAASLIVLFSALLIGTGGEQRIAQITVAEPPVYVSASIEQVVGSDNTIIVSQDESVRMTRGMMLLGAPGMLRRFISPLEMTTAIN